MHLVLASQSPRRVQLLRQLLNEYGVVNEFAIEPADIDETPHPAEPPRAMVLRLAEQKAAVIAARHAHDTDPCVVIAADTTVDLDGQTMGQPADMAEAAAMLRRLAGRTHWVHTGVCVVRGAFSASRVESAQVTMVPLSDGLLERYVATQESLGKAGAYAIQGEGGVLVSRLEGSLTAVIGLPIETLADLLDDVAPGWNWPG
jgi:septum formation protein